MRHVGQTLIFAVGQRAFEINGNWFSTLLPLATLDGQDVDPSGFPESRPRVVDGPRGAGSHEVPSGQDVDRGG